MPNTQSLTIKGVETDEELRRAHVLMMHLRRAPFETSAHWLTHHAQRSPRFLREHTRIVVIDTEVVGALRISTDIMRIGEARLKVGGLSWIAIAPQDNHQEILQALMTETLAYLQEHRYHLSVLFSAPSAGIPFGYTPSLNDFTLNLNADDIPPYLTRAKRTRLIKPGDIETLLKIHTQCYGHIPCSLLREYSHMSIRWAQLKKARVFTNAKGKIEGYILAQAKGNTVNVYEMGASQDTVYSAMLAYCTSLAHEPLHAELKLHLPREHPFSLTQSTPFERRHNDLDQSAMVRIIDLEETLESFIPEWEHQIHKSLLREMDCEITLIIDSIPYRIRVHFGVLDIAQQLGKNKFTLSRQDFTQLLCGYEHFDDVWSQDRRLINREGKALLQVLFPKRNPYITQLDRC